MSEKKLELFGMLAADPDLDLKDLVQELRTPHPTLVKWKKEHKDGLNADALSKVLDMDEIIIKKVAEAVADEVIEAVPKPKKKKKPKNGEKKDSPTREEVKKFTESVKEPKKEPEIELIPPEDVEIVNQEFKDKTVKDFTRKIVGLQSLKGEVQATAGDLVNLIAGQINAIQENEDPLMYNTKDITLLTQALMSIQSAMFNKPVTQIGVNMNAGGGEGSPLLTFMDRMKN